MFSFISETWNPVAGACSHGCVGCWARELADRHSWSKYQGVPRVDETQIGRRFKEGQFVFVQDMTDLFAEDVPREVIACVLGAIYRSPDAKFLLLTKNPKRYFEFVLDVPDNCVLGVTIESDRIDPRISGAPNRQDRMLWMLRVKLLFAVRKRPNDSSLPLFVSIEPILDFNLEEFANVLGRWVVPWAVAVGYDNYGNGFPEPQLAKTLQLIEKLESVGIKVYRKTLREQLIPESI